MVDTADSGSAGAHKRNDTRDPGEFQDAMERLEKAVQDMVGSATNEFSDRAAGFVDDITARLAREFDTPEPEYDRDGYETHGGGYRGLGPAGRMRARRRARRRAARDQVSPRSARLYRDPAHQKIGGVCAGIASYYGMETWVVRCMAVTGLLFLPSIVFPAYWIAYFVMDKPPRNGKQRKPRRSDHNSPAPELGPKLSPRHSLRNVQADLTEVELRLRRMESHVTSGQYELQRELNRIEADTHDQTSQSGQPR